jgi:hypothetical protein
MLKRLLMKKNGISGKRSLKYVPPIYPEITTPFVFQVEFESSIMKASKLDYYCYSRVMVIA